MRITFVTTLLLLLIACAPKPHARIQVNAPSGAWIALFNGKDLSDWTVKIAGHDVDDNYRNTFRVEDGLLKVTYQDYDHFGQSFGSLFYKRKFSHYWLRAEYRFVGKLAAGAPSWAYKNSGIQLHSQAPQSMRKDQSFPVSVEFDIVGDRRFSTYPTGDVCKNGTQVKINGAPFNGQCSKQSDVTIAGDEWVTALAEVEGGTVVRQVVNGNLVVEYTDLSLDESNPDARSVAASNGGDALTSGYISIQSNGHPIEFRRIEVLPLD